MNYVSKENSQTPKNTSNERLALHLNLLRESDAGRLDELECPECRLPAVSVWFTHPAADVYRTWFICANCDFYSRVQNTDEPLGFSEDRINTELEEKDLAILKQAIFKRPPLRTM